MATAEEPKEWFYLDISNKQLGPVTLSYLTNNLPHTTLIWKEGDQWVPLSSIIKNEKTDEIWYILFDDTTLSEPLTKWSIVKKAKLLEISKNTLVWLKGTSNWRELENCGEFRGYLNFIQNSATIEKINDDNNNNDIPLTKDFLENKEWFYKNEFQEIHGPIPLSEILFKLSQGILHKFSVIKCKNSNIWRTIESIKKQFNNEWHEIQNNIDNLKTNDEDGNISENEEKLQKDINDDPTISFLALMDKDYCKKKELGTLSSDSNTNNEDEQKNNNNNNKKKKKKRKKRKLKDLDTSIYITGLPNNIDQGELYNFVEKCGIIAKDIFTSEYKIKIYKNENNVPKGDALVTYQEIPSVTLAIQMLDQEEIRDGYPVTIKKATFDNNKSNETKTKKRKLNKKQIEILKKMNSQKDKLSWDNSFTENDDGLKIIILKNMFRVNDIGNEKESKFFNELKIEVKNEIENTIGMIQDIKIFENNNDGIIKIKFYKSNDAKKCIEKMNHRYFNERIVECFYYDGITDYYVKETIQDQDKRLKNWLNKIDKK